MTAILVALLSFLRLVLKGLILSPFLGWPAEPAPVPIALIGRFFANLLLLAPLGYMRLFLGPEAPFPGSYATRFLVFGDHVLAKLAFHF